MLVVKKPITRVPGKDKDLAPSTNILAEDKKAQLYSIRNSPSNTSCRDPSARPELPLLTHVIQHWVDRTDKALAPKPQCKVFQLLTDWAKMLCAIKITVAS